MPENQLTADVVSDAAERILDLLPRLLAGGRTEARAELKAQVRAAFLAYAEAQAGHPITLCSLTWRS